MPVPEGFWTLRKGDPLTVGRPGQTRPSLSQVPLINGLIHSGSKDPDVWEALGKHSGIYYPTFRDMVLLHL